MPRPHHVQADPQAQADFKQRLRPLLRDVATAFPQATVELWAVDEHRIGLKPILRTVWTLPDYRPLAPVEHRYAWRYLVGFVHPASGRTVGHLATTVSIALFSVELEAFAQQVGTSPAKQIVLVLDGAGARAHSPALFAIACPGAAAGGALVAADEHGGGQLALRHHRAAGGRPSRAVRRAPGPAAISSARRAVLLVAAADPSAPRSEAKWCATVLNVSSRTGHVTTSVAHAAYIFYLVACSLGQRIRDQTVALSCPEIREAV